MRKHNFNAGPSVLPLAVLEELQRTMVDFHGTGLSLLEASHRSGEYEEVHHSALRGVRSLLEVPDTHDILFLGGGATMQFAMVPMNLMGAGGNADIVHSGSWASKALADIRKLGTANVLYSGKEDGFTTLPDPSEIKPSSGASYLHITSNETIGGLQWKEFPRTGEVPLVADMSSDILSRRIDVSRFGLIYAGAQKNIGPAGVTVVIIRRDLLERIPDTLPAYLDYRSHATTDSLLNTPPVFAIHAVGLVMNWIRSEGGLDAIAHRNVEKASLLYQIIDSSPEFYRCPVDRRYRSDMNVVFRLRSEELEKSFITEAAGNGMIGLKGHRSVGGIRASLYNAMPVESVNALAEFMTDFERRHP